MPNRQEPTQDEHFFDGLFRLKIYNPRAARLSATYDRKADKEWFAAHPGAAHRDREASDLEKSAFGFPNDGTYVFIRPHMGAIVYIFAVHGPSLREHRAMLAKQRRPMISTTRST